MGIKKLHLIRKGNRFFAKNLLKYLNNVSLSSDTTGHDSVPKISKYSAKDNTIEESQANVSKIPISSNLPFDNEQTKKHLEKRTIAAPPKSLLVTY